MIQTDNLTFRYKKSKALFRFPKITLARHENLLILGTSGIGKTTLLHLLAGLLTPISGKIQIGGTDISTLSQKQLDAFRGAHIGLVFQKKQAISSLTVFENLQTRLYFSNTSVNNEKIETLLKDLDLYQLQKAKVRTLSEGQLQRLGIALAVVHNPQVILADEPTSSLDDANCKNAIALLKQQAARTNAHLIVITHDHRIKTDFEKTIVL